MQEGNVQFAARLPHDTNRSGPVLVTHVPRPDDNINTEIFDQSSNIIGEVLCRTTRLPDHGSIDQIPLGKIMVNRLFA